MVPQTSFLTHYFNCGCFGWSILMKETRLNVIRTFVLSCSQDHSGYTWRRSLVPVLQERKLFTMEWSEQFWTDWGHSPDVLVIPIWCCYFGGASEPITCLSRKGPGSIYWTFYFSFHLARIVKVLTETVLLNKAPTLSIHQIWSYFIRATTELTQET